MTSADVTARSVVTVAPDDTVADAARMLREHQVSAVVVTERGAPIGILTERDIVHAVVDGADPATTPVRARMSSNLVTVRAGADPDEATELMARHGIRHVPIVDGGVVVGMVSLRDRLLGLGEERRRKQATDFGDTGVVAHFKGPYSGGPPPKDLEVDTPPIDTFGFAELRRMVVIYTVLVVNVLRAVGARLIHPGRRTWFEAASHGAVDGFEKLGPTFVKLGQLIASSPGIFPAPLANACQRCLDEVPPFDGAEAREMIRRDLGRAPNQVFKSFDENPLSAASIGQVHACVLPDGREAVIKLQRPNIRERMTVDLRIMHRLARSFEKHTNIGKTSSAVAVIEDLHSVTFGELNPALEAWRQHRFREKIWAFGDNEWITAPEVYWDYCGPHMICMERMSGIPMDEFDALAERGVDGEMVLRRGAKVWLEALMAHGPFHGDMHAGNIWVLDDGRATYLDFGIMGELDDEWRDVVRDLLLTLMVDRDWSRLARAYKRAGVFPPEGVTDEELGMRLGMMLGPMLDSGLQGLNLGDLIKSSIDLMQGYGAKSPKELMLIAKQLLYIERYAKGLAPDYRMLGDVFLVKNVFPAEVAARVAADGLTLPE